jgi:CheY-like chemotaxis protein
MFFASKIRAVAEAVGVEISFTLSKAREADLIVVDLHHQKIDVVALAKELKSNEELRRVPLVGFFSHVETELQRTAKAAGFDQVLPRSVFARDLHLILGHKEAQKST